MEEVGDPGNHGESRASDCIGEGKVGIPLDYCESPLVLLYILNFEYEKD